MTDLSKRRVLKTISVAAGVVSIVPTVATARNAIGHSVGEKSHANEALAVHVQYQPDDAFDRITFSNPGAQDLTIRVEFVGQIDLPGAKLDSSELVSNRPIHIAANGQRHFSLPRHAAAAAPVDVMVYSHSSLRFPVSDGVIIGNISIIENGDMIAKTVPVILSRKA